MERNIHAGMRVLYKTNNSNWLIGELCSGSAIINENGLFLPILPKELFTQIKKYTWDEPEIPKIDITDIFFDGFEIDEYIKDYKEYFMTKEEYIAFIQGDNFDRQLENAYVSDGEYGYYPVSRYTKNWIEKQPFDYIYRSP